MNGVRPTGRFGPWVFSAYLLVALHAYPDVLAAQQVEEEVDSARIRVLERLTRLSKPPGVDSTLFLADSLARLTRVAGPPSPTPVDSFMAALFELPGYSVSQYAGNEARFDAVEERLTLIGSEDVAAELRQDGMTVTAADTISMVDSLLWTAGETLTERPGEEPVRSSNIIYDTREGRGSAFDANTKMSEGAVWIMDGDLPAILPDTVFGHDVNFTSCQEEEPHYHFAARELKAIGGSWFVARNVTLNFADVPVLWLPFIFQSTESGRRSGILTPRFGVNDIVRSSRGHTRRLSNVGFFWAMNDYADVLVAGDWWSDNFTALTTGFRYRVTQKFLSGGANVRRYWRVGGGRELSFDTRHSWEMDERTQLRVSARYASSSAFVRQNSFDPREVTQSINSEGGLNRRLDWGNLSLSANRRQFLSDDRVEMTLPTANLSLKTLTLLKAPASQSRFYNNLTWSGSGRYSRSIVDRADQVDSLFVENLADNVRTSGSLSSGFNLGAFSWSQSLTFNSTSTLDLPALIAFPGDTLGPVPTGLFDKSTADLVWSMGLGYQQRLIGTTTLTPSLSISGTARRSDDIPEAASFVSGPRRISFGARLKSDVYGYYGGIAGFEAIRHKISPSINYSYAPEIVPTDLQRTVFGSNDAKARNIVTFGFNQTFEAKRPLAEEDEEADAEDDFLDLPMDPFAADSLQRVRADSLALLEEESVERPPDTTLSGDGPTRLPASRVVNLLTLNTSVVTYDFVRARDEGARLEGFTTTRMRNQIGSDFLRGLQLSIEHDLFDRDATGTRIFDPILSQLNLSFSLRKSSGPIQALGRLLGRGEEASTEESVPDSVAELEEEADLDELNPLLDNVGTVSATDETNVIPGAGWDPLVGGRAAPPANRGGIGDWNANFSYSLRRSRSPNSSLASKLLQVGVRFRATEMWNLTWRTSYDVEDRSFTDHSIGLTRDLHRWQANFDFYQTATGNWTFRFEVSLKDNPDLKFDYDQRSSDLLSRY